MKGNKEEEGGEEKERGWKKLEMRIEWAATTAWDFILEDMVKLRMGH